jgi:hypothetical protein
MATYHITKYNFLKWYFVDGQDSENDSIKQDLGDELINSLFSKNSYTISTEDIFKHCIQDGINISSLEEFKDSDIHTELFDYDTDYKLILID